MIPELVIIDWVMDTPERKQGFATMPTYTQVPVLLIKYPDSPHHWCGYVEWPDNTIPFPEERVEVETYTRPTPTFYGPSGPIIQWQSSSGWDLKRAHDSYWVGFDLQANPEATPEEAEKILKQFIATFYTGYVGL